MFYKSAGMRLPQCSLWYEKSPIAAEFFSLVSWLLSAWQMSSSRCFMKLFFSLLCSCWVHQEICRSRAVFINYAACHWGGSTEGPSAVTLSSWTVSIFFGEPALSNSLQTADMFPFSSPKSRACLGAQGKAPPHKQLSLSWRTRCGCWLSATASYRGGAGLISFHHLTSSFQPWVIHPI